MDPRFDSDAQNTGTLPGVAPVRPEAPVWLEETRAGLSAPGRYLAFEQDGSVTVIPITRERTRIGRSLAADLRFDDSTVSRRHAILAIDDGGARLLDDRSLNGVRVNRRRVDSCTLVDGDELLIGRHVLYFLDTAAVPASAASAALND